MATVKKIKKAQNGIKATADSTNYFRDKAYKASLKYATADGLPAMKVFAKEEDKANEDKNRQKFKGKPGYDKDGFPEKKKNGGKVMIKRADGSTSQRGLWDNIRAAKGSGKKPTPQMLKQEKKIKLQSKKK
jgi:hypothetical protein